MVVYISNAFPNTRAVFPPRVVQQVDHDCIPRLFEFRFSAVEIGGLGFCCFAWRECSAFKHAHILKVGCAHSRRAKNRPCTARNTDGYHYPTGNREYTCPLRIHHGVRAHAGLCRSKRCGGQYCANPDGTSQASFFHFPLFSEMHQLHSIIHAARQSLAHQQQPQNLDKGLELITMIGKRLNPGE